MLAEASQEVRMLLLWPDGEIVDLPHVTCARDKSDNLGERDSSPVITVLDDCCEGVVVCGVRIECDLG
jgi:hypothetical protein